MEFGWSDEQRRLWDVAVRFAREELTGDPVEPDPAGTGSLDRKAWQRLADFGVPGLPVPVEYGGQGADLVTTTMVLEALGYGCRNAGLLFSLNAHLWSCALPILRFGNEEQKRRYLPLLCDGSWIGAHAVTETGSGSDAFATSTTACRDGAGHYVLNGVKTFITNAPVADVFIVLARTGEGIGGLCAFVVERSVEGLSTGPPSAKLGLRGSPMGEVVLTECRTPASALLGGVGAGMTVFNTTIEWERSFILATAVGSARRRLEESIGHAREHRRFGRPIGRNQSVAHRIVDMRVRLDAARLLLYHLAWLKDQGRRTPLESAAVKLFLSDMLVETSLAAFDNHGAYAYVSGSAQEQDVRDALASRIYSGTSDIQRNIIASTLGL